MKMIDLLKQPSGDGYPADFLFARLRGKRQRLLADRSDSRELLHRDYGWVFAAMPRSMRKDFAPCFLLLELRSVQMILRFVEGQDRARLEHISAMSLLHRELLRAIVQCDRSESVLELFDSWFGFLLNEEETLMAVHDRGGNRLVEEMLVDSLLQAVSAGRQKREIADFIADQIDMRNLLTAARYQRWQLDEPPLLAGGGEESRQLREAQERSKLETVIPRLAGGAVNDVALLESALLGRIARRLELAAREPLGRGLVVDYLWRRYLAWRRAGLNSWAGSDVGAWEAAL